jgi:hypothetical protein
MQAILFASTIVGVGLTVLTMFSSREDTRVRIAAMLVAPFWIVLALLVAIWSG